MKNINVLILEKNNEVADKLIKFIKEEFSSKINLTIDIVDHDTAAKEMLVKKIYDVILWSPILISGPSYELFSFFKYQNEKTVIILFKKPESLDILLHEHGLTSSHLGIQTIKDEHKGTEDGNSLIKFTLEKVITLKK